MKNILLLHGWGGSTHYWDPLVEALSSTYKTDVIKFPGIATNEHVPSTWGVPEYAEWLIEYINNKSHKDVVLIGHSFGGRVAAEIAAKKPKWLRVIILDSSPCIRRPSFIVKTKIKTANLIKHLIPKTIRQYFYYDDLRGANKKGLETVFRNVISYDQTNQLRRINVPCLIIWGKQDKIVPLRIGKEMSNLILNSEFISINNAGHMVLSDSPKKYITYVTKFLDRAN